MEKHDKNDERIKLAITVNNRHFIVSINEIAKMVLDKSNTIDLNALDTKVKKNAKLATNHSRLRTSCRQIQEGITLLYDENTKNDFDVGRIIKKIYKTLTQNFTKLYPEPNLGLFELTNEHGERITIIPGLDINLVSKLFTEEELKLFWGYIYMMYISVVNLISIFNNHKETGDVWAAMPNMKLYMAKSGILKDGKFFNPFLGITKDKDGEYGINEMYKNVGKIETPSGFGMKEFLQISGVDNLIKPDQLKELNDQLKNISQDDVNSSIDHVLNFMGAQDNPDIKEVCSALTREIVSDIQGRGEIGLSSMVDTAQNVIQKLGNKLDRNKMVKTAKQLSSCMQNGEANLKNMKDEKGNPIGMDIFSKLSMPLGLLKKMEEYSPNNFSNNETELNVNKKNFAKEFTNVANSKETKDTDSVGSKGSNSKKKDTESVGSKSKHAKESKDTNSVGSKGSSKKKNKQ